MTNQHQQFEAIIAKSDSIVVFTYYFVSTAGKCNQVVKRIEKDMVTQNENCYQKAAEICGPANCKVKCILVDDTCKWQIFVVC